jgi:hypothetical protein
MASVTRFYKTPIWTFNPLRCVSVVSHGRYPIFSGRENEGGKQGHYSEIAFSTLQGHIFEGEEVLRVYTTQVDRAEFEMAEGIASHVQKSGSTKPTIGNRDTVATANTGKASAGHLVSDAVVFEVASFSKGCGLLGKLVMPLARPLQDRFLEQCCSAMASLMKQ